MNLLHPPERLQALAREYALGTLHGGARRRFERLLHESLAARSAVARWQQEFAGLALTLPPVMPRAEVWEAVQQRLGLPAAPLDASRPAGTARQPAAPHSEATKPSWWQRWWGGATTGLATGAMAAVVASVALLQANPGWIGHEPLREELPASYVGLLSNPAGQPVLLLSSRRHGRVLTAKLLRPLPAPAGQVAVLWAFPSEGGAPFVVGTLAAATGSTKLPLPETSEKLFFKVARLGVSFEPAGAPLPAAPSGELAIQGPCVKLW
jgi:anti-sigma-K factor RskA